MALSDSCDKEACVTKQPTDYALFLSHCTLFRILLVCWDAYLFSEKVSFVPLSMQKWKINQLIGPGKFM